MAQVYLLSATDPDHVRGQLEVNYLRRSAARDVFKQHTLVDDPASADIILFAEREGDLKRVRRHPYLRRFREKSFVVNPRYKGVPLIPGVYASVSRTLYDRHRIRSGHYLEVVENDLFSAQPFPEEATYLYSFAGTVWTAPVRRELAQLEHPRGYFLDTSDEGVELKKTKQTLAADEQAYIERYVELCRHSMFVLCPRGTGPSSLRLFESMLMGRAPVIISDDWVAPEGPRWETFSIRVSENAVDAIPALLEQFEARAEEMGRNAREAWEKWFSEEVTFHRTVEQCLAIQQTRALPEAVMRYWSYARLLQPAHLQKVMRAQVLEPLRSRVRAVTEGY
jgi:hypothetical protein